MKKSFYFAALIAIYLTSCVTAQSNNSQIVTIGDIQGCSHKSPFNGSFVQNIKGVVTHVFTNGFTIQSLSSDLKECSSDAVFVTTGEFPKVMPGQLVSVDGVVAEYTVGGVEDHNLSRTEIHQTEFTVLSEKAGFPDPVKIGRTANAGPTKWIKQSKDFDISKNGLDYYESLEFMLVEVENGIVVGPKNEYNEFVVLPKTYIDSNKVSVQGALLSSWDDENPEKIMVDAASIFTQEVNVGDKFSDAIIGIMDYSFGNFKIWTIMDPLINDGNNTSEGFEVDDNSFVIATYNLENFSQFDDAARIKRIGCQIVKDLQSPDILVLNEVLDDSGTQDDGLVTSQQTLELLIKSISNCGGSVYAYSDNPPEDNQDGGITGGNIRMCILYRQDNDLVLDHPATSIEGLENQNNVFKIGSNPQKLFSNNEIFFGTRKPTIWLFTWKGEQFVILGTHLVSQSANTPDWGDIHPIGKPEQIKRESQMDLINNYLLQQSLLDKKANIVILGDFNDYPWSDSLKILKQNQDLFILNSSDETENYSYIHEGNAFQFDYIVVSQNLRNRITQFVFPHINTIYNSNDQVSDHDPVLVEISGQK